MERELCDMWSFVTVSFTCMFSCSFMSEQVLLLQPFLTAEYSNVWMDSIHWCMVMLLLTWCTSFCVDISPSMFRICLKPLTMSGQNKQKGVGCGPITSHLPCEGKEFQFQFSIGSTISCLFYQKDILCFAPTLYQPFSPRC